jgi:dTMP kinase
MAKKDLKKGVLITFEGPEGSGKSTQIKLLCRHLRRMRVKVLQLREPGSTQIGEKIRDILLDPKNSQMSTICEMLLYQAARAQLVKEKILSALRHRTVVILDRFLDATICYQGAGSGLDVKLIKQIGALATWGLKPDLTILLDLPVHEGLRRSKRRDRIERKSLQFHLRVRKGYLKLADANPGRIKVVAPAKEINKTQNAIREIVHRTLRKVHSC